MSVQIRLYVPFLLLLTLLSCGSGLMGKDANSAAANSGETTLVSGDQTSISGEEVALEEGLITVKPGDDVAAIFRGIKGSKKVKMIRFEPGDYVVKDTLHLPRTGGLVIIDGQGSNIKVIKGKPLFYSVPKDQSEAMVFNKTRFLIKDFGQIQGGTKAIFLGSSFNTVIQNIEFGSQTEAAIDLVFCLMCTVKEVLVTNVEHDGIVLRSGVDADTRLNAWPGTSYNNSQCNHTVLQSVRVYNKKGCTGTSFKVLQSTGVRLLDCISEGWENERAVFFDASRCTTAKFFSIQNFHLEHTPRDGALVFRSFGSTVEVDGLFLQTASKTSPAIWLMNNGNYIFKNIPWWPEGAWVNSSHSPSVVIQHCTNSFYEIGKYWRNGERPDEPIYKSYFRTSGDLVR
jgi:hypothetical protein